MTATGPLAGYRVIEVASYIAGPYAGQLLGDLGADVIKVERPAGDPGRYTGESPSGSMAPMFMNLNRNKRSVVLDLKTEHDRTRFDALVESADVVLHNLRPSAVPTTGLDEETVRAIKPDLVTCRITGFGSDGPYADRPAYDDVIQGVSGFADLQGIAGGHPAYAAISLMDHVTGLHASQAIVAALLHRERTGEGQAIEVPMFETGTAFYLFNQLWERTFDPDGAVGYPRYLTPKRRPFPTRDGWFSIVMATDYQFDRFFIAVGRPELAADERFTDGRARAANADALNGTMTEIFAERTNAEWTDLLRDHDLPGMAMHTLESVFADQHLDEVGFFRHVDHPTEGSVLQLAPPVRFDASPASVHRVVPHLGEHTDEVLSRLGFEPQPPEQGDQT